MTPPARVLIVDDSALARAKLGLAVRALGHDTVEVDGGAEGLGALRTGAFDLVLLDIVMEGVDGFAVLRTMRADPRLREVPTIVVSGLENEPGAVIDAIRLGAVDFLPKAFESVLLRARIGAALSRKRSRDRELAELAAIERLTGAARTLESTLVSDARLGLDDLVARDDPLGRFAGVFVRMAAGIHDRERRLLRRVAARQGIMLLLVSGVLFGLGAPLSSLAMERVQKPLGLALWVNAITAALCLAATAWRGTWPTWTPSLLRFTLLWGVLGASAAEVVQFVVLERVPASTLSLVIVLESFLVFGIAALVGREAASARRLSGLVVGALAVLLVLGAQPSGAAGAPMTWLLVALAVPAFFAAEDLLLAWRLPDGADLVALVGFASLAGSLMLAPGVWWTGQGIRPSEVPASVPLLSLSSLVGTVLHARLMRSAGAVFGSQTAYVITLAGVAWAMLLLGERFAPVMWVALGLMFTGLLLIEPRREPDDVLGVGLFDRDGGLGRLPVR